MQKSTALVLAWIVALATLVLACQLWWLQSNELPDGFQNEYEHLYTLTEVYFRLRDNSLDDAWAPLWDGYYPPMEHAVATVGMTIGGRSRITAVMSLGVFLVLLLGATGWVGLRLRSASVAAVAVGLVAFYPAVFGNARRYEPNIPLAAFVALAAGLLVVRSRLDRKGIAVAFGVLCGLGLLSDRVGLAVYLAPVAAVALVQAARRERPERLRALLHWTIAGAAALAVCGYYYYRFFQGHVDEVWTQLGGEISSAGDETLSLPPWTFRGLLYYPLSFLDAQMGPVLGSATIIGISLYLAAGRKRIDSTSAALLDAWLLGGLLVFTLISKKQPFYSIPLLAPAAVCASIGWHEIKERELRIGAAALGLLLGLNQLAYLTSGEGVLPTPGRWAYLAGRTPLPPEYLGYQYTQAAAPMNSGLDIPRMAELCATQREADADRPITVVFSDAQGAYEGQLMPTLRLELDTLLVEGLLMSPGAARENVDRVSCFVYVTDSDATWPSSDAITASWAQWGVGEPDRPLLEAVAWMEDHADPLERWTTERSEHVHVYTLVPGSGG